MFGNVRFEQAGEQRRSPAEEPRRGARRVLLLRPPCGIYLLSAGLFVARCRFSDSLAGLNRDHVPLSDIQLLSFNRLNFDISAF